MARNRRRCGAAIFESLMVLCLMLFIFFSLFQVYQWVVAKIFCHYSSYYGGKGMALGYQFTIARRAARVAAIAISGAPCGNAKVTTIAAERDAAERYMNLGDASGVWYQYWYPRSISEPQLMLSGSYDNGNNTISTTVRLQNAPLISANLAAPLGISNNPEPSDKVNSYNYSTLFLEE